MLHPVIYFASKIKSEEALLTFKYRFREINQSITQSINKTANIISMVHITRF